MRIAYHPPTKIPARLNIIENGYQPHIEHTLNLSIIDVKAIKNRSFSVVLDAVNGAASLALPEMVETLGCKVHRLFCEPNGDFPRGPEPLAVNLKNLERSSSIA